MTDLEAVELAVWRAAEQFGGNGKLILQRLASELAKANAERTQAEPLGPAYNFPMDGRD